MTLISVPHFGKKWIFPCNFYSILFSWQSPKKLKKSFVFCQKRIKRIPSILKLKDFLNNTHTPSKVFLQNWQVIQSNLEHFCYVDQRRVLVIPSIFSNANGSIISLPEENKNNKIISWLATLYLQVKAELISVLFLLTTLTSRPARPWTFGWVHYCKVKRIKQTKYFFNCVEKSL